MKREERIRSNVKAYRALAERNRENAALLEQAARDLEWVLDNAVFISDEPADTDDLQVELTG